MLRRLRLYISPYFLPRYYLIKDIRKITNKYKFEGKIIDIGCGNKPYINLFPKLQYEGIDFKKYSVNKDFIKNEPDYYFKHDYLKNFRLPFSDNSYDNSVSFQVFEHHEKPEKLISEMVRITKKGGYILTSVPFLGGIHEEPNDYQRYTKYGLIELFKKNKCRIILIKEEGSIISTVSMLFNEYLNSFAAKNKRNYLISIIIFPPLLIFSYIALFADKIFKSKNICFNYIILVKK